MDSIKSGEIQWALNHLQLRAIPSKQFASWKYRSFRRMQPQGVIPASEVFEILKILMSGDFEDFYRKLNDKAQKMYTL